MAVSLWELSCAGTRAGNANKDPAATPRAARQCRVIIPPRKRGVNNEHALVSRWREFPAQVSTKSFRVWRVSAGYSMSVCCMEHESSGFRCTLVADPKADILNLEELQHAPYPSLHRFLGLDRSHCCASVAYGRPGTSRGPRSDPGLR